MSYTEEELFVRTVAAEARGEGTIGQALVARSILNRAGLIQSGTVGKGTFSANDSTITGVIYGKNQYQVVRDGSINKNFSKAELDSARKAIAIARNPADLRGRLEAQNIPPNEINSAMAATGFRTGSAFNDPSQNVNVTKFGNHYFNTAGNSKLKTPNANVKETISPGSTESPADVQTATDSATGAETKSDKPVKVPDKDIEIPSNYVGVDDATLDSNIESTRKEIDELNEKSSDLWTDEEAEKYKELKAKLDSYLTEKAIRNTKECNGKQTDKGYIFKNTPDCEKFAKSVAAGRAATVYNTDRDLPDPCGTSEMSKINTALQKFFATVKGIKKYANLYVNGAINKISNITSLIRSTSQIIGGVLKTLTNRLRDFLIDKIRKGFEDLVDMLLPTIAKSIKNTIVQAVIDNIFCAFKDVIKNLVNLAADFLFELVGKIVNVPFCVAEQFTNALINNVASIIDSAVGPILDSINDILGGITKIVGNVFQALDFILGFEAFICAKPNCPEIKKFKASPWAGPSQAQIDAFDNFLPVPTAGGVVGAVDDYISNIEIFGSKLGDSPSAPSDITECDPSAYRCGPPKIEIFGGGGLGAVGEAVVDNVGRTIGVSLSSGGSGYSRPPFVAFVDNCNDSFTNGYTVIDENQNSPTFGQVIDIIITNQGVSPPNDGRTEFDAPFEGDDQPSSDFIVCLDGFRIVETGIGFSVSDSITITPNIPDLQANVRMTEAGQIIDIEIADKICGLDGYPEITINSPTGNGAVIEPVLSFVKVANADDEIGNDNQNADVEFDTSPLFTLRGRKVLREKQEFTRRNIVRVIDCVS